MTIRQTGDIDTKSRLAPLGRFMLGAGIVLILLRGIELVTRMPGLPSFWYANQPMWIALGFGMAALGWQILWGKHSSADLSWRPAIPGRRFRRVTVYVSEGCHLCHEAIALLAGYRKWLPEIEEIDIGTDQKLVNRFGTCVPVVVFDGKIRFRGKVNEVLLRRLIEGTIVER